MNTLLLLFTIFLAVFTQSISGFGSALVAMAILPAILGIQITTPLVALVSLTLESVILYQYRHEIRFRKVIPLLLGAIIGIPIGVTLLKQVNEVYVLAILGTVIAGYAIYALLNVKLPALSNALWAYLTGFISGVLGGAYNTSGPPVIIYGDCRRWSPGEFKGNLQGFFLVSTFIVVITHWLSGNFTSEVLHLYLLTLPAIVIGLIAGFLVSRYMPAATFRKVILWLLVLMGVRMIITALFV